jgi:serine/threonine protein kinase
MIAPDPSKSLRVRELFVAALRLPAGPERNAWLAQACGTDADLRARIQALLDRHRDDDFLAEPAVLGSPAPPAVVEKPGYRIGHYKLLEQIGEGGCGVVYVAEQEEPVRRRVALKILKLGLNTREVIARFEAEQQALALMEHSNIAKILDAGVTDSGRPYFVMELVRGIRMTEFCDQNKLNTADRLELFAQVCHAVQHAHQKGVIHRDLKPSNILVTVNDGQPVPKVIDFGIAKATAGQRLTDQTLYTAFQQFIGTPAYMSPEQATMTNVDIDTRSDIYSLGVLLYELLTGQTPFDARELLRSGLDEMSRTLRETEPVRPSTRLQTMVKAELKTAALHRQVEPIKLIHLLRGDLDWIVMKALEKDRNRRYESAIAFARDVQCHLQNQPILARPPSALYRLRKFTRRHRLALAAGITVLASLVFGGGIATRSSLRARADRQVSELRLAESSTRSGDWPGALKHWDAAEQAGYANTTDLGLKRAEAWIVLHERAKARAEFDQLLRQPDLGTNRNAVLLRAGEFEMFDRATFPQGAQRVGETLTNGLDEADQWLAKGLLADSTTNALAAFRRALEIDPYLHSAHRHSLGLEFALGRHEELAAHLRIANTFYRGDFSPGAIEVAELALHGRLAEAQIVLASFRNSISAETYSRMERGIRLLAQAVEYFDVEVYLGERTNGVSKTQLLTEATQLFLARRMGDATNATHSPLPQLPCVEQGIGAAFDALKDLTLARVLGGAARTDTAIEKLREGYRHHPEALFPTFAGTLIDNQQPRAGPRDLRLLALQSEMYQWGADSPSILPNLGRLARLLAVDVQEELALSKHTNAAMFRTNCVVNLRRATFDPRLTPIECRSYSRWSHELGEHDLDRQFLARWETLRPGDTNLVRHRIRLEIASAAYGPALKLIDSILTANSTNQWAMGQRRQVLRKIEELNAAARPPTEGKP